MCILSFFGCVLPTSSEVSALVTLAASILLLLAEQPMSKAELTS